MTKETKEVISIKTIKKGFEVTFRFDPTIYHAIKNLDGSYWLPGPKKWVVGKNHKDALLRIAARHNGNYDSNGVIGSGVQGEIMEIEDYTVDKTMPKLTVQIPLKMPMREYQEDGVAYAIEKGSCLMGDQQGLGKTLVAIAAVIAQNAFPCLVICKSSLTTNWEKEINKWSHYKAMRFNDSVKRSWPAFFTTGFVQFGIVSYDSISKYFVTGIADYKALGETFHTKHINCREEYKMFKSVIVDESHLIKDPTTIRTKMTVKMCLRRDHVYLLTGTPVLNNPSELYPQLVALGKSHLFGSQENFNSLFGKSSKRSAKALPYLNHLLHKNCYFRRLKADVAKDIPPKTREIILCDIDNRKEYDFAEQHFATFLKDNMAKTAGQIDKAMRAEALVQIGYLKHLSAKGKLGHLYDWLETQENEGEKAVVFVHHKDIQEQVFNYKRTGTVRLCGSAAPDFLAKRKQAFQESPEIVRIVCSLMADAEGHTLTAASNLAMFELPWHFGKAEQCEDRIHRISTVYPVTISYFLGENTIDRRIYDLIMAKKDMHDAITGTDEEVELKMVDLLINSIFNQKNS